VPQSLGVRSDLFEAASGCDAIGFRFDDARVDAPSRVFVALLDQQPALVTAVLAAVAFDERPAAVQFFAMQHELELALPIARRRITLGFPVTAIPQQHGAGPVLLGRNHTLEVAVLERVIFDVHREPLVRGIQTRTLRDRPAQQNAVELQSEIVVEMRRRVFLNDERRLARTPAGDPSGRLRRRLEVALLSIEFERHPCPGNEVAARCR
jgi:hypothetical protein